MSGDKKPTKKIAIPVSDELNAFLSEEAARNDISMSEVIRRALKSYQDAQTKAA